MLIPIERLLSSISGECRRLGGAVNADVMGSSQQALGIGLDLLRARERAGIKGLNRQLSTLRSGLESIAPQLPATLHHEFERLIAGCESSLAGIKDLSSAEQLWRQLLREVERLTSHLDVQSLSVVDRSRIVRVLTAWETADLRDQLAAADSPPVAESLIDASRMAAYLQDRFSDASIRVPDFRVLPGGFGKQTFLFSVDGQSLQGDFVLRRDANEPIVDNDCHRIHVEYALIDAVHARGFPAPELAWLDTEHRLLPGGDFLVMRRSPGVPGGNVFGSSATIPAGLTQTLAGILARLHALTFSAGLSQLNESINQNCWEMPLQDCVRQYLNNWRNLYLRTAHLPSPAMVAQFGWLLDNLPPMPGRPVLLHGDIGFHNFLFQGELLSAVLDWEFAHLGDPAEDLAYVRNTLGSTLSWPAFMQAYREAGGAEVDEARLRFFQVWGHLRNACASNLAAARFVDGSIDEIKMVILPHAYIPMFLDAAQQLIDQQSN